MLKLFAPVTRQQYLAYGTVVPIIAVLMWICASQSGLVSPLFLPGLGDVAHPLLGGPSPADGLEDFLFSTGRILAGFLLAVVCGVPIGLYIGSVSIFDALRPPVPV